MRRRPSLFQKAAMMVVSVIAALAIAEAGVGMIRQHAFPYLNIYVPSDRYGVALEPEATTRVRSRSGRITTITTNSEGFRGDEWPARGDVLLLGDSQMFGYNVDVSETTAAGLHQRGHTVLNAAVPTWGPTEYVRIAESVVPTRRPTTVVFVANVANDWYETHVPNIERSAAVDGWLTMHRRDTEPTTPFIGRRWLMSRSQLVFVARAAFAHTGAMGERAPPATAAMRLRRAMPELSRSVDGHRSRVTPHLLAVDALCKTHGCSVIAVALPLDVQVDGGEWSKYRGAPADLSTTRRLAKDFLADAQQHGIVHLDLFDTLVRASPGAFLDDDYHLSARGHQAVADALAEAMKKAPRSDT